MKNCLNTSKFTEKNVVYYIQLWSHFNVLSHTIQQNLAAEIEWIYPLKFLTMQNFQMPTLINCLNIMLLLFTTFKYRYLPNFIFSWKTAHLILQKIYMSSFNYISYWLYNITWYAYDERKSFFPFRFEDCLGGDRSGQFGMFYFLLNKTDWSWWFYHFHFWVFFKRFIYV